MKFSFLSTSPASNTAKKKKGKAKTKQNPNPIFSDRSSPSPSSPIYVLPHVDPTASSPSSSSAKISMEEVEIVLRRLGGEDAASLLDGNGMLMLEDVMVDGGAAGEEELRGAFAVFDADGDGKISAEELHGAFALMGDHGCSIDDCRRMIRGVDSDGDDLVSFGDFVKMMRIDCQI